MGWGGSDVEAGLQAAAERMIIGARSRRWECKVKRKEMQDEWE
jgi:hypothetical protein